jgi:hypothetical protein
VHKSFLKIASLFLISASTAYASMSVPMGWYVDGNAGKSRVTGINLPGSIKKSGFAWSTDVGYKFNAFNGVELGYSHFARLYIRDDSGTKTAKMTQAAFDLAYKVILPAGTSGLEVFGKIGYGRFKSHLALRDPNSNPLNLQQKTYVTTNPYLAAGLGYNVMPNLQINAQWARLRGKGATGTPNLYTLGLSYLA